MSLRVRSVVHHWSTPALAISVAIALALGEWQLHLQQLAIDRASEQLNGQLGSNGDAIAFQGKTLRQLAALSRVQAQQELGRANGDLATLQAEINALRVRLGMPPEAPIEPLTVSPAAFSPRPSRTAASSPRPPPSESPSQARSTPTPTPSPSPTRCAFPLPSPLQCF